MIDLMVGPPPTVGDFVLTSQIIVTFGAWQVIMLHLFLVFLIHRHDHPPASRLFALEEDHLLQSAGNGDVELAVIGAVFELPVVLAVDEALHKIPKNMRNQLRRLVVEVERRVIFVDAE